LATLDVIESEGLVERAAARGKLLGQLLAERLGQHPAYLELRGMGLLLAAVFDPALVDSAALAEAARGKGLILNALGKDRIRLAPPLVVSEEECAQAVDIMATCVEEMTG
jgi:4-aminobutyrate aminotransferase-like enzyme